MLTADHLFGQEDAFVCACMCICVCFDLSTAICLSPSAMDHSHWGAFVIDTHLSILINILPLAGLAAHQHHHYQGKFVHNKNELSFASDAVDATHFVL